MHSKFSRQGSRRLVTRCHIHQTDREHRGLRDLEGEKTCTTTSFTCQSVKGVIHRCVPDKRVIIAIPVKTTLERCGPFSLVVLSQRRSQVTPLSGHSDQNASETFSNKLQLNKVQSSLRQTSAKTTQVRSKAKTS